MQAYKNDQLVRAVNGEELEKAQEAKLEDDETHMVVGLLPQRGQIVIINGLQFVVKSSSHKKGTVHMEIRKPKKEKE